MYTLMLDCKIVQTSDTPTTRFVSLLARKARAFRDARYHRACNRLDTQAAIFRKRLGAWYNSNDFFSNATNLQTLSRFAVILQEELLMAKTTTTTSDFQRTEWKGFLEREFTPDELEAADAWELSDTDMLEGVVNLNAADYKLTVSYNAKTKTATATLMAGNVHGKMSGWALSAKGTDSRDALKLLLYKHFHVLEETWRTLAESPKPVRRG